MIWEQSFKVSFSLFLSFEEKEKMVWEVLLFYIVLFCFSKKSFDRPLIQTILNTLVEYSKHMKCFYLTVSEYRLLQAPN